MRGAWSGVLAGLVVGALLGAVLLGFRFGYLSWNNPAGEPAPVEAPDQTPAVTTDRQEPAAETGLGLSVSDVELATERPTAFVVATRVVAPAVVSINVLQAQSVRSPHMDLWVRLGLIPQREYYRQVQNMGSGVILSEDGFIVTNSHVIEGALQVVVTLSDGRQYQARLVDQVERYDLAVLQIQGDDLPVAKLAAGNDLQIGEWAIAIGSPYGYLLADTHPTVTVGVISALNRDIKRASGEREYLGMIQTDAAINPGNSGGPLVNTSGEVVGINTFIFTDSGGSVGIGFAVPASRVLTVLDEIRKYGHYREFSLGFELQKLSPGMVQYLQLSDPVGFFVVSVRPGSPAWKADIRPQDIIREVEGMRLDSPDILYRLVYEARVDDSIKFVAERSGQRWNGEIVIEELR
jgi:serine protease Do